MHPRPQPGRKWRERGARTAAVSGVADKRKARKTGETSGKGTGERTFHRIVSAPFKQTLGVLPVKSTERG